MLTVQCGRVVIMAPVVHFLTMKQTMLAALLVATMTAPTGLLAETRSVGKHEHGTSRLAIAIDGNDMAIDLEGPAGNLLGFEHGPSSPEQKAVLAKVVSSLNAGNSLFLTSPAADCRMLSSAVSPPAFGPDDHSDLEASWEFRCGNPVALQWVDVRLLAQFPGVEKLATSIVTPAGQKSVVLTPGTPRVLLPRPSASR